MNTKLMGATRERIEGNESLICWNRICSPLAIDDLVKGDGFLSELMINHLARTIVGIDRQGEGDDSTSTFQFSLEPRKVTLLQGFFDKHLIQQLEGLSILCSYEYATCGLVEAMNKHRAFDQGIYLMEKVFNIGLRKVFGRNT